MRGSNVFGQAREKVVKLVATPFRFVRDDEVAGGGDDEVAEESEDSDDVKEASVEDAEGSSATYAGDGQFSED